MTYEIEYSQMDYHMITKLAKENGYIENPKHENYTAALKIAIDAMGKDRWELIMFYDYHFYFKRTVYL